MEDPENLQALSAPGENPRQWLADYFQTRGHLASCQSDFHCDPACTRPGCKNPDMQVQVSLVDILGAAFYLQESVSAIYGRHYSLGLFSQEREDWIRMVALKLKKPCPFLENDLCSIYQVRPLPCILFPEYLVAEGNVSVYTANGYFRNFLCLQSPILLSPERAGIMAQIKKMWIRETLISSFYLFNHGGCHLDFSNLIDELLAAATRLGGGAVTGSLKSGRSIPNWMLERFFLERLSPYQPFAGVQEKVEHLGNQEAQEHFLRLLQDDLLLRRLQQSTEEWALIYRLRRGKLKANWRSLLPGEYKFC
jgi:Fe-S-cluster containining protein